MQGEFIQRPRPEDLYVIAMQYRLHFTTETFIFGRSTFNPVRSIRGDDTYQYWTKFSNSVQTMEQAEDILLANILDNPDQYVTHYSSPAARLVVEKWKRRLEDFDQIFGAEIKSAAIEGGWKSDGTVADALLNVTAREEVKKVKVDTLSQMLDDQDFSFVSGDERTLALVRRMPPECLAVLDELVFRKKGESFLLKHWKAAPHALTYFLRCWKYRSFLPIRELCNTAKAKIVMEML
jgi:hypothetical protein